MPANLASTGEDAPISDALRPRLRALVRCLGECPGNDSSSEQMLMDVDLDGHRYLLIRMPAAIAKGVSLSPREIEIVRLVAAGHPNKVIASVLEISSWTVCTHMRRVFAKFGVTSRAAMVARVAALGGMVDGMLPASLRGRLQDEGEALPHRNTAVHPVSDRRAVPVTTLARRPARLAETKSSSVRAGALRQAIR
ncbi:MAG TPA: helix-turn-helix transcriptional regulator [Acetobacteraceae bacterium]|nr:helix-turn-helix transcriptional regulator [Acetobacteraceae bacterium]